MYVLVPQRGSLTVTTELGRFAEVEPSQILVFRDNTNTHTFIHTYIHTYVHTYI